MNLSNSYGEFERKRDLYNRFILVHLHISYTQFSKQPLSSTSNQNQITTHTQRGNLATYNIYSQSLKYQTPQDRKTFIFIGIQTHTTVKRKYYYKYLNKDRKHMNLHNTRNSYD